jgi:proline iminopeptidase
MPNLYPETGPHAHGMLDVGDGQRVYWEACGNPSGTPAVVLHGGPGSGCTPQQRRFFNPEAYRVILFDQRGCGRSTPHAGRPETSLEANTTWHVLADIERLRLHLGIERWLLFGGSWGAALALLYAETYPERVTGIVLGGVTAGRREEIDWLYRGAAPLFPEQWVRFRAGAPEADRDGDLVAAYYRLLQHPDAAVRARAATDWCAWESASISAQPGPSLSPRFRDPAYAMAFARIVTHYFHHNLWLEDGLLLRNAGKLADIRGVLVQGRLDLQAPLATAWAVTQAWPRAELVLVEGAGHASTDPGIPEQLVRATDSFVRL